VLLLLLLLLFMALVLPLLLLALVPVVRCCCWRCCCCCWRSAAGVGVVVVVLLLLWVTVLPVLVLVLGARGFCPHHRAPPTHTRMLARAREHIMRVYPGEADHGVHRWAGHRVRVDLHAGLLLRLWLVQPIEAV
jgi:hypothetical protein